MVEDGEDYSFSLHLSLLADHQGLIRFYVLLSKRTPVSLIHLEEEQHYVRAAWLNIS